MPHVLLAGRVASNPKSNPFPQTGLPRVTLELDVDGRRYLIVGYDLIMAELEAMEAGDPVSIQGDLVVKADITGTITGLHIQAGATLPCAGDQLIARRRGSRFNLYVFISGSAAARAWRPVEIRP